MGKKRKGRKGMNTSNQDEIADQNSKLLINTWEDVADSEDEFHINRDKILLDEEPAKKRQRQLEENG